MRNQATVGLHEQWFIETEGGGQGGPYSAAQLARLLEQGTVAWTSKVWRAGLKDWRPARRDDVLVMAIASARGMSADTRRIDSLGSWMQADDTICEPAHDQAGDITQHEAHPPRFCAGESEESILIHPFMRDVVSYAGPSDCVPQEGSPQQTPVRRRWPARLNTPLVAVAAFAAGALFTSLAERTEDGTTRSATSVDVATTDAALASTSPLALPSVTEGSRRGHEAAQAPSPSDDATTTARNVEVVTRSLPAMGEVREEIERVGGAVRRCVRRAEHVDIEVSFEGQSGHVGDAIVRTETLRKERVTCVARVLHSLQVAPFVSREFRVHHRYVF